MNSDQIKGKWTEIKGQMQSAYGDLTDDELEQAKGDRNQLEGLLQNKYGKTKEEAKDEFDKLMSKV